MSETLYKRLGSLQGITKVVNDAVDLHLKNPIVKTRFENSSDIDHAKKMSVEFFCAGSGGPESYSGRDLITAHSGMNISEQEYLAVVDDIMEAMEMNNVGENEKKDVLSILFSLKEQVIRI